MSKKATDVKKFLDCLIWLLIGAVIMTVIIVFIEVHQPTPVKKCNDGWSTQVEDGVVYKTYIAENDTCHKEK